MKTKTIDSWPLSGWCLRAASETDFFLFCGSQVEQHEGKWFSEAAWCGDYDIEGFLSAEILFGTGGAISSDGTLVLRASPSSPLDRLFMVETNQGHFVSNSLVCLLAVTELGQPESLSSFGNLQNSIIKGLAGCQRELIASGKTIKSIVCENLRWDGKKFLIEESEQPSSSFATYEDYISFLETNLRGLLSNGNASGRSMNHYPFTAGISTGYDSPFICAVARNAGLKSCYTFPKTYNDNNDDGSKIAEFLGLPCQHFDRYAWKKEAPFAEAYIAAGAGTLAGIELLSAQDHISGSLHLVGWHGDMVWGMESNAEDYTQFKGVEVGMSYCEWRLHRGIINVPVCYIGIDGLADIINISNSSEMKAWDYCQQEGSVDTHGGSYSRPICRRALEEAGVPRNAFAGQKMAIMTTREDLSHSHSSLMAMYQHSEATSNKPPSWWQTLSWSIAERLLYPMRKLGASSLKGSSRIKALEGSLRTKLRQSEQRGHNWAPWALEFTKEIYRKDLRKASSTTESASKSV